MSGFQKATKLTEVAAVVDLTPLEPGDARYVNLTAGRGGSDELAQMRLCLMDHDARANRFAKIAFTGHRGTGKSTELLRLEHDLRDHFTALHLYADEALLGDYDYTDLFLWLVDALVRQFEKDGLPLDKNLVEDVATWFAEVTLKQADVVKSEVTAETEAKAEAKTGFYWLSLGLLARLKSVIVGSTERRTDIRKELQRYSSELINRVNLLLDHAHSVLGMHGKPANLLIVVDNLDRLEEKVCAPLFFDNGGKLKSLRAHVIYTVPIALVLAPRSIGAVFENAFTLCMVKVRTPGGNSSKKGVDALVDLVEERMDLDTVFASRSVVRRLAEMSGGSVRDLMRLIQGAQRAARVEEKNRIDRAAADRAILRLRLDFERLMIPGQDYYPILAQIHASKGDGFPTSGIADPEKVQKFRVFFAHFLFNGSVLEYNGERMWYDVHPIVLQIDAFQRALSDAPSQADAPPSA